MADPDVAARPPLDRPDRSRDTQPGSTPHRFVGSRSPRGRRRVLPSSDVTLPAREAERPTGGDRSRDGHLPSPHASPWPATGYDAIGERTAAGVVTRCPVCVGWVVSVGVAGRVLAEGRQVGRQGSLRELSVGSRPWWALESCTTASQTWWAAACGGMTSTGRWLRAMRPWETDGTPNRRLATLRTPSPRLPTMNISASWVSATWSNSATGSPWAA